MRSDKRNHDQADLLYEKALDLADRYISDESLLPEALNECFRLDHSIFDMLFFILARRTRGTLFTADAKLQNLCLDHGVECVALVDL